jgi:hypothetical protein
LAAGDGFAAGAPLAAAAGNAKASVSAAAENKLAIFLWAVIVWILLVSRNRHAPIWFADTVKPGFRRIVSPDKVTGESSP